MSRENASEYGKGVIDALEGKINFDRCKRIKHETTMNFMKKYNISRMYAEQLLTNAYGVWDDAVKKMNEHPGV